MIVGIKFHRILVVHCNLALILVLVCFDYEGVVWQGIQTAKPKRSARHGYSLFSASRLHH